MPSRALTDKEFKLLIQETLRDRNSFVGVRDCLMYYIGRYQGFRPKEVRCIKMEHLNLDEETIFIPAENNKERHSDNWFLLPEIATLIRRYLDITHIQEKSIWLFPSFHNKSRHCDKPVHEKTHQHNFMERLKKLGILKVSFIDKQGMPRYQYNLYSLRKRYGTEAAKKLAKQGFVGMKKLKTLLRHRDQSCRSVQNYIDMAETENAKEIMKEVLIKRGALPVRLAPFVMPYPLQRDL